MAIWMQHVVALLAVGACGWFVLTQAVRTLRLRKGTLGCCCSRGCLGASKGPRCASVRVTACLINGVSRCSSTRVGSDGSASPQEEVERRGELADQYHRAEP